MTELAHLKDFQRDTAAYVHQRLWLDRDTEGRFLVADEVGLGKTMVGRGVIATTIDHLWDQPQGKRIDIVYICSNGQIASQNLRRLNVAEYETVEVDRLSMMPLVVGQLQGSRVNILSLTPGTSMDVSRGPGKAQERALLHYLLAAGLERPELLGHEGWVRFFRGQAGTRGYSYWRDRIDHSRVDVKFAKKFVRRLKKRRGGSSVVDSAIALTNRLAGTPEEASHGVPEALRIEWRALVGRMRHEVASAAVELLDPDLVILDEFHRFRKFLRDDVEEDDADSDAVALARAIFDHKNKAGTRVRVLLLSATPYAMFTLAANASAEHHENDFHLTTEFLGGKRLAESIRARQRLVREAAMGHRDAEQGKVAARSVEGDLRKIMCRTERLAVSTDRDGMLRQPPMAPPMPTSSDILSLGAANRLVSLVGSSQDPFEFWRASPYLVNLMEKNYEVKRHLISHLDSPSQALIGAVTSGRGVLPWSKMRKYEQIDLGNPKLRLLWDDLRKRNAPTTPWIPAALPYYEHQGAFARAAEAGLTKRLVFSAWAVAPRAIATLLSYQAEQLARPTGTYDKAHHPLLAWARSKSEDERMRGMPVLALTYPFVRLAEIGDPRAIAAELGQIPARTRTFQRRLARIMAGELAKMPSGQRSGPVDERWYWAAPMAMDHAHDAGSHRAHLEQERWVAGNDGGLYADHIAEAEDATLPWLATLGRRPDDLPQVLARLAVAGPGVCALRALHRTTRGTDLDHGPLREYAHSIGKAFRSMVNSRELTHVIGKLHPSEAYWRAVLMTCVEGNLQSTLDEFVHVLTDSNGLVSLEDDKRLELLSGALSEVLTQRAGTPQVDIFKPSQQGVAVRSQVLRTHFAVRYGREQSDDKTRQTEKRVRDAFNSPFWPFVLASTSVGQEGLDFHMYSHAVVHWNLPSNPVDLEQREGRVHRFKGHAVRKNVAADHAAAALDLAVRDPWEAVFAAARAQAASAGLDEVTPYWVYPKKDGAFIERYVVASPLSRETARFEVLVRMLADYRLTIGQPRQEDLIKYVGQRDDVEWMLLNLAPPRLDSE
ncbi:MAG TPA: helicase-related protein [Jatrophihabitans sp.]|uniref:DEAD/DEAH box helicase n=1 Tax=Jatrophihabitans sp. TaxID=1932789 RepID=UPI002EF6D57B